MKKLLGYYGIVALLFILGCWPLPEVFPRPQVPSVIFPRPNQTFDPDLPVLPPGVIPQFPQAAIILQTKLFAPFVIMPNQNLQNRNLENANLFFADLKGAHLQNTNLSKAILVGARLEKAKFNSGTKLPFSKQTALLLGMEEVP